MVIKMFRGMIMENKLPYYHVKFDEWFDSERQAVIVYLRLERDYLALRKRVQEEQEEEQKGNGLFGRRG